MEDAIQSHRPRLTIGHWRLWLRRCKLHVPHARVATTKWDWTPGDLQGWVADWLACLYAACSTQYWRMLGGHVGRGEVQRACKINCAVQYSVHGEVPSCDEA